MYIKVGFYTRLTADSKPDSPWGGIGNQHWNTHGIKYSVSALSEAGVENSPLTVVAKDVFSLVLGRSNTYNSDEPFAFMEIFCSSVSENNVTSFLFENTKFLCRKTISRVFFLWKMSLNIVNVNLTCIAGQFRNALRMCIVWKCPDGVCW